MTTDGTLASWRDTATRTAIVEFVESATGPGGLPPEDRVAVFDNDGTLWCEKPMPIQADFLLRRIGEMAQADPSLTSRQPWKAVAAKDYGWLNQAIVKHYEGDDTDLKVMAAGLLGAYANITIEQFDAIASEFLATARHPSLNRPYAACVYQPMVELLDYLAANGFTCYIATGGGRDFLRVVSQELYGIPPDRVIGSSVDLEYREDGDTGQLMRTAALDVFDDGPAKPVRIWSRTGRRPVVAGGNANGDLQMLQFAGTADRPGLRLLVLHDDAEREFDYTRGADQVLDRAKTRGWTVVSMKDDWTVVFG
ncbi:HAD family hydrolase [Kribbella sp. CA-253562]|uniref:HAD family hydrolase n=1 Tax=Kribbella sp. CA-253562 TaxID=3239942 RepID=UPI003D9497DF